MPSLIRNSRPITNSVWEICLSDHHEALFFTHSGIPSENEKGMKEIPINKITKNGILYMVILPFGRINFCYENFFY